MKRSIGMADVIAYDEAVRESPALNIVVDPDGSRWVSVEITERQMAVLSQPGALEALSRDLSRAVRQHEEKRWDDFVTSLAKAVLQ